MHESVMKTYKHNIDILVFLLVVLPFSFSKIEVEPLVEMRWDFTDCGQNGRFGPSQVNDLLGYSLMCTVYLIANCLILCLYCFAIKYEFRNNAGWLIISII